MFVNKIINQTRGKLITLNSLHKLILENQYMTTCGVIASFRAYYESSRKLGINLESADEYDNLADELHAALHNGGNRYVTYPGCAERSISAFSGTFPYPAGNLL